MSAFANRGAYLHELGFTKIDILVNGKGSDPDSNVGPCYTAFPELNVTFARDETGQSWLKNGLIDLSVAGFVDISPQGRKVLEALGQLSKAN